jgi:hypothetical protein
LSSAQVELQDAPGQIAKARHSISMRLPDKVPGNKMRGMECAAKVISAEVKSLKLALTEGVVRAQNPPIQQFKQVFVGG